MSVEAVLKPCIRVGKTCPDFFFHEQSAWLLCGEKEAKSRTITFSMSRNDCQTGEKVTKSR